MAETAAETAAETTWAVKLVDVSKTFGHLQAVKPTSLSIAVNEFFSILGPSGCGKTTLMRMIAGFERPTTGTIELGGVIVNDVPTRERDLNMLFQSYAIFPHLNVYDNVAFELRVRKTAKADLDRRVREALDLVRLPDRAKAMPSQLSGGQRQRVALARAVVSRPEVVLLDEPLGALDQRLRKQMQVELKRMQREVGITFVYVTHDQEEALTMSDRIAVMSDGVIHQVASPSDIYDRPATRFVGTFIGDCNVLVGAGRPAGPGRADVRLPGLDRPLPARSDHALDPGAPADLLIRPERVRLSRAGAGRPARSTAWLDGKVKESAYLGSAVRYGIEVAGGQTLTVSVSSFDHESLGALAPGEAVVAEWEPGHGWAVDGRR